MPLQPTRNYALDILRVFACFLVIWQHSSEFFYIGDEGSVVTGDNTFWVGILTSIARLCVPLFVMLSGYFLLPMKGDTASFFKKRFTRVLYPFIVWCVIYAVYFVFTRNESWSDAALNILKIPVNFGVQIGHLWYIYMLLGLYMLVPILSPWLKSCSKKELQGYLWLWVFTTALPYIHQIAPEILGECFWNPTPMLYYFTGFSGFLLLGYYFREYGVFSIPKSLILIGVGYALTAYIFCSRIDSSAKVWELELSWGFCTTNVLMMTVGVFSLFSHVKSQGQCPIGHLITDISEKSYAIYLAHIIVLNFFFGLFKDSFTHVLVAIPLLTICTFISSYILVKALSYLPKNKYWLGV